MSKKFVIKRLDRPNLVKLAKSMQDETGSVAIMSVPPGARIYIDEVDTEVNSSAIIGNLEPGDHDITLILEGYEEYTDTVYISPEFLSISLAILTPLTPPTGTGTLNVTSNPTGAEFCTEIVIEEENVCGEAPTTLYNLPAGYHVYEAGISEDYTFAVGTFLIEDGKTTDLNIPLFPLPENYGFAWIESIPIGANINIDGEPLGAKTGFLATLSPESHTYELTLPGYQSKSGPFTVIQATEEFDVSTIISETLQPSPTVTGTALLMVGAVAIGAIIMTQAK